MGALTMLHDYFRLIFALSPATADFNCWAGALFVFLSKHWNLVLTVRERGGIKEQWGYFALSGQLCWVSRPFGVWAQGRERRILLPVPPTGWLALLPKAGQECWLPRLGALTQPGWESSFLFSSQSQESPFRVSLFPFTRPWSWFGLQILEIDTFS